MTESFLSQTRALFLMFWVQRDIHCHPIVISLIPGICCKGSSSPLHTTLLPIQKLHCFEGTVCCPRLHWVCAVGRTNKSQSLCARSLTRGRGIFPLFLHFLLNKAVRAAQEDHRNSFTWLAIFRLKLLCESFRCCSPSIRVASVLVG